LALGHIAGALGVQRDFLNRDALHRADLLATPAARAVVQTQTRFVPCAEDSHRVAGLAQWLENASCREFVEENRMTSSSDSREQAGLKIIEQLGWGQNEAVRELDEDLWRLISEINFGAIWSRPGMSLRDRELICMAILIAIGAPGVTIHFKNAHRVGITEDEIRELILQTIPYAGVPKALQAMAAFRRVQAGEPPKL
jgi:4-carboxymuconolactone decarboxylase